MAHRHPFFDGMAPTLLIAHRGGAALAPENTLLAFRGAVETYRCDMLEIDVHATRDGQIVVAHDDTVERCTSGAGAIAAMTYDEIFLLDAGFRFSRDGRGFPYRGRGVAIPLLAEVLRAFPAMRFNLEIKPETPEVVARVAEVVRGADATTRVCIGSEHDAVAERLLSALPEACHFFPRQGLTSYVMALLAGDAPPPAPFHVLDMPLHHEGIRLVSADFIARAAADGKWVNVWTIDDPAEMRRLRREGVGGIMTDRPDLLRDVLNTAPT